jgi:diguanylate cyclase (GGDEF)-like protein
MKTKQKRTNHSSRDIRFYVLLLLIFLVAFAYILLFSSYLQERRYLFRDYAEELRSQYKITLGLYSILADTFFEIEINTPEIKGIFAAALDAESPEEKDFFRKKLYQKLILLYEELTTHHLRQLHFHEANNVSFLRFHRPNTFGDDLTGSRYSVEYVNREEKALSGFEEGRIYNGYRFVYPLELGGRHLGSVELSLSYGTIIDQLKEQFGKTSIFILRKDIMEEKVFEEERANYLPWSIDPRFVVDKKLYGLQTVSASAGEKDRKRIRRILDDKLGTHESFCALVTMDGGKKPLTFLPVSNLEGEPVGYFVALSGSEKIEDLNRIFFIQSIAMLLLLTSLSIFTVYYRITQKRIDHMITYDFLTKAYSRSIILQLLESEMQRYIRYGNEFSVIMLDIDHFKNINDTYGHQTGDEVLTSLSKLLKATIRTTDALGRYGGEEFIILLTETSVPNTVTAAEHIRLTCERHRFIHGKTLTISCGVAGVDRDTTSVEEIIRRADENLYKAKKGGRNMVVS